MNRIVVVVAFISCSLVLLVGIPSFPAHAASEAVGDPLVVEPAPLNSMLEPRDLATIVCSIEPISQETKVRRSIAQATFCLPQNILGVLLYGWLHVSGTVVNAVAMNEVTLIVTTKPIGVSLGKFIFLPESYLTEHYVRHEYGHTLQGYNHGPFFLLFEGVASFVQAAISLISPSFAEGYYERWPENEANELGELIQNLR